MDSLEEKRLYYPRVSDILSKQTEREMRLIPTDNLVTAALRGTAVHRYCTTYLEKLFLPNIEDQYMPYVDAFISWADENIHKVLITGRRYFDDELHFSGEPDAIVLLKGSDIPVLIDIKTSCAPSKSWPLQLAAYQHLCNKYGHNIGQVMIVHLKKSVRSKTENIQGEKVKVSHPVIGAKQINYPDLTDLWRIFSSALICYDYFDRKQEKEKVDV